MGAYKKSCRISRLELIKRRNKMITVLRYEKEIKNLNKQDKPVIFLAGPTVRGNQQHLTSWRFEAIEEFKKQGFDGYLIVPEFNNKFESDKGRRELPVWEFEGLKVCDVIMFWIPRTRELIGLTTNQEFGYWMARDRSKVVYGRPDDAYRIDYQDIMWVEDAKEKNNNYMTSSYIYNTLEKTIRKSIYLSNILCSERIAKSLTKELLSLL